MTKIAVTSCASIGGAVATVRRPGRITAALTAALLLTSALTATPGLAESLREAMQSTYKTNPRLDAERARLRATDEEVARAHAGYRPQISGSADMSHQRTTTRPPSLADGEVHP